MKKKKILVNMIDEEGGLCVIMKKGVKEITVVRERYVG